MPRNWDTVDRISNAIVDLINAELQEPESSPVDLFASQLLALLTMAARAAPGAAPESFFELVQAAGNCLIAMKEEDDEWRLRGATHPAPAEECPFDI